jgi:hypothetical protein
VRPSPDCWPDDQSKIVAATKGGRHRTEREEDAMSRWTRRDLLRASAASAAVAVPTVALRGNIADAARSSRGASDDELAASEAAEVTAAGPLMVCVHDAEGGAVSILHGTEEIVVNDRRLVSRIVRAKSGAKRA